MSIWLAYPEVIEDSEKPDNTATLLDDIAKLDADIGDTEENLVNEVKRAVKELEDNKRSVNVENVGADSNVASCIDNIAHYLEELVNKIEEAGTRFKASAIKPSRTPDFTNIKREISGIKSIRIDTVENLSVDGDRWLVKHHIPGRSGIDGERAVTVYQDMGRKPIRISFKGYLVADDTNLPPIAQEYNLVAKIELLKKFFRAHTPLYFASRLHHRADLPTKVMIESLKFEEHDSMPYRVAFDCVLTEYSELEYSEEGKTIGRNAELEIRYRTLELATRYRTKFTKNGSADKRLILQTVLRGGGIRTITV
jgi:hypothetical protein